MSTRRSTTLPTTRRAPENATRWHRSVANETERAMTTYTLRNSHQRRPVRRVYHKVRPNGTTRGEREGLASGFTRRDDGPAHSTLGTVVSERREQGAYHRPLQPNTSVGTILGPFTTRPTGEFWREAVFSQYPRSEKVMEAIGPYSTCPMTGTTQ